MSANYHPSARLERAADLAAQGRVHLRPRRRMTYDVADDDRTYLVHLLGHNPCTCRDRHCEHFLAASLMHLATIALGNGRVTRGVFKQAAPRRGHPIWYEVS